MRIISHGKAILKESSNVDLSFIMWHIHQLEATTIINCTPQHAPTCSCSGALVFAMQNKHEAMQVLMWHNKHHQNACQLSNVTRYCNYTMHWHHYNLLQYLEVWVVDQRCVPSSLIIWIRNLGWRPLPTTWRTFTLWIVCNRRTNVLQRWCNNCKDDVIIAKMM